MRRGFRAALPLCVLAATLWSAAASGQPGPWEPRKKPHAVRALCIVRDSGKVDCVRLEDLRRTLSADFMEKLDQVIRDILEDFGLGSGKNALFACRGGWKTANLNLQSAARDVTRGLSGSVSSKTRPSVADAQNLVNQCRQELRAEIEAGIQAAGMGRSEMVRETVGRMDQAVAGCKDRSSPVAAGDTQWAVDRSNARSDYQAAKDAVIDKYYGAVVAGGDPNAQMAFARLDDYETLKKALEEELDRTLTDRDQKDQGEKRSFLVAMLAELAKEVQDLVDTPVPPAPKPTNPSTGPAATPAPAPTKPPSSTTTPCDPGDGCKPSCEEIQQRWSMFKEYCEQSDWRAYQCEVFLRAANGCVDMTLINPGPEGDMTCPARAKVDKMKESYLAACRKQKWIMIPSGDRDIVCTAPDFEGIRPGFDPCNNPRVMPDPDSCFGGRGGVAPDRERRPPRPQIPE